LTAGALVLASVTAYAQMNHRHAPAQPDHGMMQDQMHSQMHGQMPSQMHSQMRGRMFAQMQDNMHGMQSMPHGQQQQSGDGGHGSHDAHGGADGPRGDRGPSSLAFHGINEKMHEGMSITFTGNTDVDFVNGMIPHHQGAVEMAKVVLAFGKDPEIRKLAEAIIQAQEGEIAMMRAWLKRSAP
jgi:uncharacterized protein (DUF305 family)